MLLAGAATAVALFAIVSIKVLLGQSALSSGDVSSRIQSKHQRVEQLQVEVARAESPAEITRRALELGMVHPDGIVPVRPAPPGPAKATGPGSR
jgi:cell division protein FtsL